MPAVGDKWIAHSGLVAYTEAQLIIAVVFLESETA